MDKPISKLVTTSSGGSTSVTLDDSDTFVIANGNDTINCGGGTALISAAGRNVTTIGGTGAILYAGGTGSDLFVAKGGGGVVYGGTGGGTYFGDGHTIIEAGSGAQAVMVGKSGDYLASAGLAGDLFGVVAGDAGGAGVVMDGSRSTGSDVFFGAAATYQLSFIAGSGNDIIGVGQGTNTVSLGSGRSTVFANTANTSVTTITAGSGSADIGLGGKTADLILQSATARTFNLFNFVPGADKITLQGYSSDEVSRAVSSQANVNGSTVLTLSDKTAITLIGTPRADASFFS